MINIGAEDYNVLKQQYIKKYIRLELLDFQYNIVDELSGNMTKCSINVDSNSDLRRSCDLGFVVTTSTFDIKAGSKIFLDRMVRPYVGYENMRTGEIQWYNQGIYLVNNPQWSYNASTNEISMQALDLMSKLTGLRNGNLEGIPTKIAKDENVREAIIKTIELGGFTKYICEECKTNDGTIVPVPYDIEIDVGGTIYDILTGLRDIMPNYQIYFDINGVFHYEPIPLAYDDPVLIDDDLWPSLLISENINTDFESVKNYVEVLGHTWDVDYYSPSDKTTVSGGVITPTFADLKELQNDTAVGITLPSDIEAGGGTSILPDGYDQLEYIQSSGTQYIDTGFLVSSNNYNKIKFVVDCDIIGKGSGASDWLINGSNINNAYFYVGQYQSKYYYGCGTTDHNTNTSVISGRHTFTLDTKNKKFSVSDVLEVSATTESVTTTANLYLCGFAYTAQRSFAQKLYGSKIYQDDVLVRDFIPCKTPSGAIGLYDIAGNQFYSNSGTGLFTAGPETPPVVVDKITINYLGNYDVVDIDDKPVKSLTKDTEWIFQFVAGEKGKLPSTYRKLEYIQSSGKQYIDTGVIVKDITEIKVDFQAVTILSGENQYASSWVNEQNHIQIGISGNKFMDSGGVTYSQTSSVTARTQAVGVPLGTVNLHLYLFAQSESTGALHYSSGRIFSCQITTADGLVRNFVPCKNPDGVIGMYDVVNGEFYQSSNSDTFIAGTDLGPGDGTLTFWHFMGHQQAQALSYDNNPFSPFYVGDPIGSSSVGRIRIVLYGGEYDNIYSDDLAQQRADFEIYQRSRLNDSISMETIPIPWMDANIVVSHRFGQKQEPSKYIVKSFSVDYATGGTMTINAITWYPYYEESEVV